MEALASGRRIFVGHANTVHDPAFALIEGDRVFAEAIERHTQCKRAWETPRLWYSARPIRKALAQLGVKPVDAGQILFASSWSELKPAEQSAGQWASALCESSLQPLGPLQWCQQLMEPLAINQLRWLLSGLASPGYGADLPKWTAPCAAVDARGLVHHLAHASMAAFTSPFEDCTVLIADGYGEGTALSVYDFRDERFELIHQAEPELSLGSLYTGITDLCGFDSVGGEEWKMMGLAAYGKPRHDIHDFFSRRMLVDGLRLAFRFESPGDWSELQQMVGGFGSPGSDDDEVMRAADLAHNFQLAFEQMVLAFLRNLRPRSRSANLAFAGGCALNSSLNGKIVDASGFERLHVPSAPADDGNALGAALYLKHVVAGEPRVPEVMSPYLGSAIEPASLERILRFGNTRFHQAASDEALCREVAELLAEGCIVGWVQGRAEYGPRALGNRSILADPRSPDMKQRINDRVKFRELYRPLAPAILHERGPEYFEDYQESPYMERALRFRPEVRDRVPAVVHLDGTGRLQTVKEEWNPLFHRLIRCFFERTGVPILVNTSFNVMGKPIIHSAEDALTVFHTTGLDRVVIGRYVLEH